MAVLTAQNIVDAGTKPTYTGVNATDYAPVGNGKNTFLHVKNADGTNAKTVTLSSVQVLENGDTVASHVVTVALSSEAWIPLRKLYQNDSVAGVGNCVVTYAGTGGLGSVTAAVVVMG